MRSAPRRLLGAPLALATAALAFVSCKKEIDSTAPDAPVPDGFHLLAYPSADLEMLLGHEVTFDEEGRMTIQDARRPGCEVKTREVATEFEQEYNEEVHRLSSFAIGRADISGVEAKLGRDAVALYQIKNVKELIADLAGECGDVVIDRVRVGTGERFFQDKKTYSAKAGVRSGQVPISGGHEGGSGKVSRIAWSSAQAYMIHTKDMDESGALPRLDVMIEPSVQDGGQLHLRVSSTKELDLVVAFVEADGKAEVIFPSSTHPDTHVPRGGTHEFPPMQAGLRDPAVAATERLIIFGFTERQEFDRLRPPAGSWASRGPDALRDFEQRFDAVPVARRARVEAVYRIEPR